MCHIITYLILVFVEPFLAVVVLTFSKLQKSDFAVNIFFTHSFSYALCNAKTGEKSEIGDFRCRFSLGARNIIPACQEYHSDVCRLVYGLDCVCLKTFKVF